MTERTLPEKEIGAYHNRRLSRDITLDEVCNENEKDMKHIVRRDT